MTKPEHAARDEAYLQGLAGRPGTPGPDQEEGQRLRQALLEDNSAAAHGPGPGPDWADVLNREAANAPRVTKRPRWAALAASVLVCSVALWQWWPNEDSAWRGGGSGVAALWISAQPQQDAEALAAALQGLGATVKTRAMAQGVFGLEIEAPALHREAVNARLAALDTALDAHGRAHVQVRPAGVMPQR